MYTMNDDIEKNICDNVNKKVFNREVMTGKYQMIINIQNVLICAYNYIVVYPCYYLSKQQFNVAEGYFNL